MANLNSWSGIGADVLRKFLDAESGANVSDPGSFGVDLFTNGFEDEFPGDPDDVTGGTYVTYSPEANRASETRPWGQDFGDRPKVHELNQPPAAQVLGWRVIDLYPNRDIKHEFYRLAGTPSELRLLTQITQLLRFTSGNRIDFKDWFEKWEAGFPDFSDNRSVGNFQLGGEKPWRNKPEQRPRYREWTNSQQRADLGYRIIEYWPDRSVESSSYVLSGSDADLIRHIIQIEYEGGGNSVSQKGKGGALPYLKGQPLIKLYFSQDADKVGKYPNGTPKQPVRGEISFRLMDRTDDPKSPLEKISKADVKQYCERIKDNFGSPLYVWEKGKEIISYRNRRQGFESWYPVRSKNAGIQLITKLLNITGQTIDLACVLHSVNIDPISAYPDNPPPITVLGEQVEQESERPVADVRFQYADLLLPRRHKPIRLVDGGTIVYV